MTPATRHEALAAGSTFFHTGRPCRAGHVADRYTSTGNCVQCQKAHRDDYAAALREARRPGMDRSARLFTYRLHPDDHAAALAYCQALDMKRGRVPAAGQAAQLPEPPRSATPEEVAAHRERILQDLGGVQPEQPRRHMTEEMRRNLRAAGFPLGDEDGNTVN